MFTSCITSVELNKISYLEFTTSLISSNKKNLLTLYYPQNMYTVLLNTIPAVIQVKEQHLYLSFIFNTTI